MTDPRRALLLHGWLQTGLWLVLVALLVHLSTAASVRFDLTRDQRHSLSEVARESVARLDKPLLARVWFSEGLEAPYHDHRRALLDLLDELAVASAGRLRVEVADPTGDPQLVARAARDGVRPIPYASRTVFMGVALGYGDRQVAVDALPAVERMEADVVGAIRRVTSEPDDAASVGWLLGHGEPDPTAADAGPPLKELVGRLRERGPFRTLAPGDAPIPEDLDTLLVVAPRAPLTPAEVVHLDQHLMRGGTLLLWLSSAWPDFGAGAPRAVDHGLSSWLGHHGVRLNRDLVVDRDHTEQMVVPVDVEGLGRQLVRLSYPLAVTTTNLDRTRRPVRDLPRLVLPFTSTLELQDPLPGDVTGEVWARTMPQAAAIRGLDTLDPRALRQPLEGERPGAHPVVVALAGRFVAVTAASPPPPRTDPEAEPFDPEALLDLSEPTRLVVVASGDALANNVDLALNALDWLADDPALIDVRARSGAEPPMAPPPRAAALRAKLLVVGAPLAVLALVAGLVRARRRR